MTIALSTKTKGDSFEQEVAEIYQAMGYEVSQHVPISGQEVDILATRHISGSGIYSVIVECKYKGSDVLAGNADVQSIAGAFSIAKVNNLVSACTLVTSNGFSLSAKQAASAAGIHLTTKKELIRGLLDFSFYLNEFETRYHDDFGRDEDSWYIDAIGRIGNKEVSCLYGFVDEWLSRREKSPLAILGGYGTGKTSFCRNYAVRLIEKSEGPIPITISLRDFQKAIRIESLIRDFLDEQCNAPAPRFETFWRMYSEGLLLMIFDGLDEMASRVDSSVIDASLMEIERFARKTGNVILTCRPEFFVTRKEENSALHPLSDPLSERMAIYDRVNVDLWSPAQVSTYVERRVRGMKPPPSQSTGYYLDRINRLPELHDMSSRAVHLDLIVRMLPNMIQEAIPITRTNLYRTYIVRELRRETILNKRLQIISDENRLALMKAVAAERFFGSYDDLNFESASKIIKEKLGLPNSDVESVTRDFLNRSFLHRDGDTYSFGHKSIGEYLFAVEVYEMINRSDPRFRLTTKYSAAVAGMVLELFGGLDAFDDMLVALGLNRTDTSVTTDNIACILLASLSLIDHLQTLRSVKPQEVKEAQTTWMRFMGLSHDLNNSIAAMRLNVDFLNESKSADADKIEILDNLAIAWNHALLRLEELQRFEFDRLNSTLQFRLRNKPVDILELLKIAVSSIPKESVLVRGTCGEYTGDENILSRIFENIALNAKHAIRNGGNLTVTVRDDKAAGLRISFANTGPEIPADLIDRIFEFGLTTRNEGQGIGLYNVKELIELCRGTIKVSSSPHETIFDVLLPTG